MSVKACRCLRCGKYRSYHVGRYDDICPDYKGNWTPPKEYVEPKPTPSFEDEYWAELARNYRSRR